MSEDQAKAFVEKMKSDDAFRADQRHARLHALLGHDLGAEGFDCSAEEIGALQELGDAELDGAVGGGGGRCPTMCEFHMGGW